MFAPVKDMFLKNLSGNMGCVECRSQKANAVSNDQSGGESNQNIMRRPTIYSCLDNSIDKRK